MASSSLEQACPLLQRLLMDLYKGTERSAFKQSHQQRKCWSPPLSVSPRPAGILLYCPFQILHVPPQVFRTPEDFAFTFPYFLLLLKKAFNPASLLDHFRQKDEDLLEQVDQRWRKRVGLEARSFMQNHCKMFSHSWAEVVCIRCPSPR